MLSITHVINPVKVRDTSDLFTAQPITFETLLRARHFANQVVNVDLVTAQYAEDREIIPSQFIPTPDLTRSVLDVGSFRKERKLPLLKDILDRAIAHNPEADVIIYTNVDIAVLPGFYQFIALQIERGNEALVINRRSIPAQYKSTDEIPLMYAELGNIHPGYDCFVFRKHLYEKFTLGNVCIGASRIGLVMMANLIIHAKGFEVFRDRHLTFHIGDDKIWQHQDFSDYSQFNEKVAYEVLSKFRNEYSAQFDADDFLQKYWKQLNDNLRK